MRWTWLGLLILMLMRPATASAADEPLLCVLSLHFSTLSFLTVHADGTLDASASQTLDAPQDAVWSSARRMLYVACTFRGQTCIVSLHVSPTGQCRRIGDPVPTARDVRHLVCDESACRLYAWGPSGVGVFPLDANGVALACAASRGGPLDGFLLAPDGGRAYLLQNGVLHTVAVNAQNGVLGADVATLRCGAWTVAAQSPARLFSLSLDDLAVRLTAVDILPGGELKPLAFVRGPTGQAEQGSVVCTPQAVYVLSAQTSDRVAIDTITTVELAGTDLHRVGRPVAGPQGVCDVAAFSSPALRTPLLFVVGTAEAALWTYRIGRDQVPRKWKEVPLAGGAGSRLLLLY